MFSHAQHTNVTIAFVHLVLYKYTLNFLLHENTICPPIRPFN